jgi:hypothetical protein
VVLDATVAAGHEVAGVLDDSTDAPQGSERPILGGPNEWRGHLDACDALVVAMTQNDP